MLAPVFFVPLLSSFVLVSPLVSAANAQVPDRLFKRRGRWKSDKEKDGYIKDNVHSLLSVSLSLGI